MKQNTITMDLENKEFLNQPTVRFDFNNPPMDPLELVEELKDMMIRSKGVGLSANQVGLPYRVFVMGNPGDRDSIIPVFNPNITNYSDETEYGEEGCLSFPGLYVQIKRHKEIRARMRRVDGETDTARFTGYTARLFQHEFDHMEGVDFRKRATRFHWDRAVKNMKLLQRKRKRNNVEFPSPLIKSPMRPATA